MLDVFAVAELLVSHALREHGDEIDIIGYYGSYARGTAREGSDLDIFYIPRDGADPPIARTFSISGILFDFWAIRWETMEGFATGRIRGWAFAPAIVHHAKVLHARSEEHRDRLAELKQRVADLQKPEARPQMIRRALEAFARVLASLGNLRLACADREFTDVRHAGWQVIKSVLECLALANRTFFDRGLRDSLGQLDRLRDRPADMEPLIDSIATSSDPSCILDACEQLALGTRGILRKLQDSLPAEATPREQFHQAYPELKDTLRGLLAACEKQGPVAASAEAWRLQSELSSMLAQTERGAGDSAFNLYSELSSVYRQLDLPDLMQFSPEQSEALASQAKLLDEKLRQWLREHAIGLQEFGSVEQFRRSL